MFRQAITSHVMKRPLIDPRVVSTPGTLVTTGNSHRLVPASGIQTQRVRKAFAG
jgi:hypothetical protein